MTAGGYKFKGLRVSVTICIIMEGSLLFRQRTPAPAHWLMIQTLLT